MQRVVLRELRDEDGVRHLHVELTDEGDVVFSGQDLGAGVERFWGDGQREYEWIWTVKKAHVSALAHALSATDRDLLSTIAARFNHPRCDELEPFLEAHEIPFERWSRVGD